MTHKMKLRRSHASLTLAAGALTLAASAASADQVIADDLIVQGSICAGQDCVNGESFGFDTLRLKENNLRIKFQDTSVSASFPSNDWQITANDSGNGGANKFSIDDIDGGRTPFTIEATAPNHSLYVDDGGRIGLGTSTPVVELHVVNGDSPTMRLEQDGSSGFTAQTWDVAGNETNFFVRDATNGSKIPFKIRPNAPVNSLFVDTDGDIGLGTQSPGADLHLVRTGTTDATMLLTSAGGGTRLTVEDTNAAASNTRILMQLTNNGAAQLSLNSTDPAHASDWRVQNFQDTLRLTRAGTGETEFSLDASGNLAVFGNITAGTAGSVIPDYVFAPDYELMPLYEVEAFIIENQHLPKIPSATEVKANGLNMTQMQIALLEKVEELTLYTLDQQKTIDALQERLETLVD